MVDCKRSDFVELSGQILGGGGYLRFRARGGSMHPFIRDGEVIEVKSTELSEMRIGDVILYCTSRGGMAAHRVIKKCRKNGEIVLMTKGDSTMGFDQPVYPKDVLGKVIAIERKGQIRRLDKGLIRLTSLFLAKTSPLSPWIYPILRKVKHEVRWILGGMVQKLQGWGLL